MNESLMSKIDQKLAIPEINDLERIYLQCRSVFPALSDSLVGRNEFSTAEYYIERGFMAYIKTSKPITEDFLQRNANLVKWINENTIIRLYGIMNYYGFIEEIDKNCAGWKEVDLMRRMRNAFTKTGLNYRPEDPDNIRLRDEVIANFELDRDLYEGVIPTPIDTVVSKIFNSCKEYIKERIA